MSIVQPQKSPANIPGTGNGAETPVQPQQMPAIPGSPPGTTYGHEKDEQRVQPEGGTVDPANREPVEHATIATPTVVAPTANPNAPQRGK